MTTEKDLAKAVLVEDLVSTMGTRVRGGIEWVHVREQHDGKAKMMKHMTYQTVLNVMGCGGGAGAGLFLDRCQHLGIIS